MQELDNLLGVVEQIEGDEQLKHSECRLVWGGLAKFPKDTQQYIARHIRRHICLNGFVPNGEMMQLGPIVSRLMSGNAGVIRAAWVDLIRVFGKDMARKYLPAVINQLKMALMP